MPDFVVAVEAIAAGSATAGQYYLAAQTILTVTYTAYSLDQAKRARRAARDAALSSLQDRTVAIRSSDEPQSFAFGETVSAGVIAYACNHGPKKEYLTLVQAFCGHEIDAVTSIKANDLYLGWPSDFDADGWVLPDRAFYKSGFDSVIEQLVCPAPGSAVTLSRPAAVIDSIAYREYVSEVSQGDQVTLVAGTDYSHSPGGTTVTLNNASAVGQTLVITYRVDIGQPLLRVKVFKGIAAGERDTDLETNSAGEWTSTAVGKGIARLHITVKWDADVFGSIGLPSFAAVFRGMKVYNFTDGSTSWSANSARCAGTYLMSSLGFNVPAARLDSASWQAAQAICDEDVPLTIASTEKRYTCNGMLSTDADRRENLRAILTTMVGMATYSGGTWLCRPGAYVTPTFTLGEDDLDDSGGIQILPAVARRDLFNGVSGRFMSAWPSFLSTSFPTYLSSTYATNDGGQTVITDIDLPMANGAERAQRIAKLMLFRHRLGLSFEASFKPTAYPLTPGDTFYMKSKTFGWDTLNSGQGKVFRVEKRTIDATGALRILAREDASSIYAWDYTEATGVDPAPNTTLPDPSYVPAPVNVAVRSGVTTFVRLSDGTIVPYAVVSWDAVTDAGILSGGMIRVLWKRADETEWRRLSSPPDATSIKLTPLAAGEFVNVRIWAENGVGTRSEEAFITHLVSADLISAALASANSRNWIANATFASGTTLWTLVKESGTTDPVLFLQRGAAEAGRVQGFPTNVLLYQGGTQAKACWIESTKIPVEPGRSYVAFASLLPVRCRAAVRAVFYDANGAVSGYGGPSDIASRPETPADPSTYGIADSRFSVPATGGSIVAAALQVYKYPTSAGFLNSAVYVMQPQLGPIDSLTAPQPQWEAGAVQTVGTAQIEPFAATETVEVKSGTSGIYTDKITGISYVWLGKVTITNPTGTALPVVVSAVHEVQINYTGTGVYKLGFALAEEITATVIDPVYCPTVPSGGKGGGAVNVQRTFTCPAQTTETYYLIAVVGAGSGTPGGPSDVIHSFPRLLAQLIKR